MSVSKRDLFHMTPDQVRAGREMWRATGQKGRLAHSSYDAEAMAPKTWIVWADGPDLPGGKGKPIIECELYVVGRASNSSEGIAMLIGMCPVCGNNFTVREDNKTMHMERVPYRKASKLLRQQWAFHCKHVLDKPVMDNDLIPVITSPERWACDYCKSWCVRVTDGVAMTDMTGVTQYTADQAVPIIGGGR